MKIRTLLFFLVVYLSTILFTSCKKEKDTETPEAPEVVETDSISNDSMYLSLPDFSDSLINMYLLNYTKYVDAYVKAVSEGDIKKQEALKKQSLDFVEQAKKVSKKMKGQKELDAYKEWITEQNKKIEAVLIKSEETES